MAYAAAFSPDSKCFLTGLDNGRVQLWDAASLTPLGEPFLHPGCICGGLFNPDGKSISTTCEDGSSRFWDLATRKTAIAPLRHQGPVYGLAFSPDGKTIATGSQDRTARLWDVATGQPIGPTWRNPGPVYNVSFLPDGKTLFMGGELLRFFPIPPELPDRLELVATWVEVITGLRLNKEHGLLQVLDNATWLERREQLIQLGGSPETGTEPRLDPILYGPDPTARVRAFIEREQWEAAKTALDEVLSARPNNLSVLLEYGRFYAIRERWSEAATYYGTQAKEHPSVAPFHEQLAVTRLLAGDVPGYRTACTEMLERFKAIDDSTAAIRVAYTCSTCPMRSPIYLGLSRFPSGPPGGWQRTSEAWARSFSGPAAWRKPSNASRKHTRSSSPGRGTCCSWR